MHCHYNIYKCINKSFKTIWWRLRDNSTVLLLKTIISDKVSHNSIVSINIQQISILKFNNIWCYN